MQFLTLLSLALSVGLATGQAKTYSKGKEGVSRFSIDNGVIKQQFIIEFADAAGLRKRAGPDGNHLEVFYRSLRTRGIDASPRFNISSDVFEGVSLYIENSKQLEDLRALRDVKNVWPVQKVSRPKPIIHIAGAAAQATWTPHENTGVLELHAKGIKGSGATVAIVDTGIDYNHPSLGGGFGSGFKVAGGYDIVGDNYFGNEFYPDSDPMDVEGHGTHVAGIVAASNDANFVSVAPEAKLLAYKVFGDDSEFTSNDALIAAFVRAYEEGADVINASIGSPSGWAEDPWAIVASRLVEKGVFVSIAAGNSGDVGSWYASSGSSGTEALAVASIDTESFYAYNSKVKYSNSTAPVDIPYLAPQLKAFAVNGSLPIYATSLDSTIAADACQPLPPDTPDLSKYLVLIRRGTCTFATKEANAAKAGAQWVWFYNQADRPPLYPSVPNPKGKGFGMISALDGEGIIKQLKAGQTVSVAFPPGPPVSVPNNLNGGKISAFSSWGPTNEGGMKPEIAAPGGNIYSTYPLAKGAHAIFSGTSMSAPYAAGVAALYIGAAGGRAALGPGGMKKLKNRIITSGSLLPFNDGTKTDPAHLAPVVQQGGGYINAKKLFYDTSVYPGKLELNDTQYFKEGHYINIRNTGNKEVFYTLSHEPAATFNTFEAGGYADPKLFPPTFVDGVDSVAYAEFSVDGPISVRAGSTNSFKVTFTPPDLSENLYPIFSGAIVITGSNGDVLSVPYMGIKGRMADIEIWDLGSGEPLYIDDLSGDELETARNFTLKGYDRPAAVLFNHFGAKENRWDIVASDWNKRDWMYPPVVGKDRFIGSVVDAYDGTMFPTTYTPRLDPTGSYYYYYAWKGELTNGSMIAPGTYRMLLSTLKPFGVKERNQDWQMKLSESITIL